MEHQIEYLDDDIEYLDGEDLAQDQEDGIAGYAETDTQYMTAKELILHKRQLIAEIVQGFPVLYDTSNPKYADRNIKNNAWAHISSELNISIDELKKKWKLMKAAYFKMRKGLPSGSGADTEPTHEYLRTLRYLEVPTSVRRTSSGPGAAISTTSFTRPIPINPAPSRFQNVSPTDQSSFSPLPASSPPYHFPQYNTFPSPNPTTVTTPIPFNRRSSTQSFSHSRIVTPSPPSQTPNLGWSNEPNRKKRTKTAEQYDAALISAIENKEDKYDANQHFLLSWADYMNSMTPEVQANTRAAICKIFANAALN